MKKMIKLSALLCAIAMLLSLCACSMAMSGSPKPGGGYLSPSSPEMEGADTSTPDGVEDGESDTEGDEKNDEVYLPSGLITAGAWIDNDNYQMWLELFSQGEESNGKFFEYTDSWQLNSLNRVKVSVMKDNMPVAGATVIASDSEGNPLYSAVSDAQGNAYIFTGAESGRISVTSGDGSGNSEFDAENREIAISLNACANKLNVIEIMLVVDVTGSMGDEISFLKNELSDVINKIAANNSGAVIKLALLFYRDTDDRVPFDYYDFKNVSEQAGMNSQQNALNNQYATGGGDYPEAVDDALELAVNKQWSTGATTKIIFHVLDAPAHSGKNNIEKFSNAVKIAAEKGIRICPIICSGAAELTEYTMREAAIHTGGTFIFVTDDSGIGGAHHDPQLPNVTVELLNSLMVRVVNGYHTGEFDDPIYWKDDPNLGTVK